MQTPPRIYEGRPYSATDENKATRFARAGQISAGPGLRGTRSANGSTLKVVQEPKRRTVVTVGGCVVVTEEVNYKDTPVDITLEPPLTTEILGAPTGDMPFPGGMMDLDSDSLFITIHDAGRYLLHYSVTCGYAAACAQAKNLSDCLTRLRLKIGGTLREASAVYGTHHSKLCVTGLVWKVMSDGVEVPDDTAPPDPYESGDTPPEITANKVAAYNRWIGGRITIHGTFQLVVVLDGSGLPKIATGLPPTEGDPPPTCAPTVGLTVDRAAIEPAPGVSPLEWFPAADTELTVHAAQLHLIRLS